MKIVMMTNFRVLNKFVYFSAAYTRVRLWGGLLVLKPGAAYTRVCTAIVLDHLQLPALLVTYLLYI